MNEAKENKKRKTETSINPWNIWTKKKEKIVRQEAH